MSKSNSNLSTFFHLNSARTEKDIHSNDASILASLKNKNESCLSCSKLLCYPHSMFRCKESNRYVKTYNICIKHTAPTFSTLSALSPESSVSVESTL